MYVRNPYVVGWIAEVVVAIFASVVAFPTVGEIWMGDSFDLVGFLNMSGSEWLTLTVALFIPSASLGMLAGRLARWRSPERAWGTVISGAVAFSVSAVTAAAFMWWLSIVL